MPGFHDVRLPDRLAFGSVGGPEYKTTIVENDAGYEQRNEDWAYPRHRYTLSMDIPYDERREELLAFFHARGGQTFGFRFKDHRDCRVGMVPDGGAWEHDEPHQFATGDGVETEFQLSKTYSSGGHDRVRKITRPVSGAVKIYVEGVEQTTGTTVSYSTGVVEFDTPPADGDSIEWTGEFDVPVRFNMAHAQIKMDGPRGSWGGIELLEVRE